jgi:2-polyprenyl-6-hydroxyphenyl methylase/3-demethylubiquinone-9 3-methyltransferase
MDVLSFREGTAVIRSILRGQVAASKAFDRLLPEPMRVDGSRFFRGEFLASFLRRDQRIVDLGSGRFPCIDKTTKERLSLHVTGIDISAAELAAAPAGSYDETVVADVTAYRGTGDADLVLSHAVLEHVHGTDKAFQAIASMVKPGGRVALFVPSRNAVFARLNLLLPERMKRALLHPEKKQGHGGGWPACYDRCTPAGFAALAHLSGLEVIRIEPFFASSYFMVVTPVYVLWRTWLLAFRAVAGNEAAETFCMELRKP